MPISHELKTVFIHVPKTGGQSISKMLGIPKGTPRNYYWEGLTHLRLSAIRDRENIEGYYTFMFVRNPYDKILSEYNWRMKNRHAITYNEPTREYMEFSEYMETLLERWDKLTPHWREKAHIVPQWMFYEDGMDVFKYEQFSEECEKIKARLGLNVETPRVNVGHYSTAHTDRTIDIVNELYKEDFERFDYNMI